MTETKEVCLHPEEEIKKPAPMEWVRVQFLGVERKLRLDIIVKNKLHKAGVPQATIDSALSLIKYAEDNVIEHRWVPYQKRNKSGKDHKDMPYRFNLRNVELLVSLCEAVEDPLQFYGDLSELIDFYFRSNFDTTLARLSGIASLEDSDLIISSLRQVARIRKVSELSLATPVTDVESRTQLDRPTNSSCPFTVIAKWEAEARQTRLSEQSIARVNQILEISAEKSHRFSQTYEVSLEEMPVLLMIASDDALFDLLLATIQSEKVCPVSDYDFKKFLSRFMLLVTELPEIQEMFTAGFDVFDCINQLTTSLHSVMGYYENNYDFSNPDSVEAWKIQARSKITELKSAPRLLADECFKANAQTYYEFFGKRLNASYRTKFDGKNDTYLDSAFYETAQPDEFRKVITFYSLAKTSLGFYIPPSEDEYYNYDSELYLLEKRYEAMAELLSGVTIAEIQSRLVWVPADFYSKLTGGLESRQAEKISFMLAERIFAFEEETTFMQWLESLNQIDVLGSTNDYQWLNKYLSLDSYGRYAGDDRYRYHSLQESLATFIVASPDPVLAAQQIQELSASQDHLNDFFSVASEKKYFFDLSDPALLHRFLAFKPAEREPFFTFLDGLPRDQKTGVYLTDREVSKAFFVYDLDIESLQAINRFLKMATINNLQVTDMVLGSPIGLEKLIFLRDELSAIGVAYAELSVPQGDEKISLASPSDLVVSDFDLPKFIKTLHELGQNLDLFTTIRALVAQASYDFQLDRVHDFNALKRVHNNPSLFDLVVQLTKGEGDYFFYEDQIYALEIVDRNPVLRQTVVKLAQELDYAFNPAFLDSLTALSQDPVLLDFIFDIKTISPDYCFHPNDIKSLEVVKGRRDFLITVASLRKHGYSFTTNDVSLLLELTEDPSYMAFMFALMDLGLYFSQTHAKALRVLYDQQEQVLAFFAESDKNPRLIFDNIALFAEVVPRNIASFLRMVRDIELSQCQEIKKLKRQLLEQLKYSADPSVAWREIEAIFIHNNLPLVGKIFKVFAVMYPENEIERILNSCDIASPILRASSHRRRRFIIFRDLLEAHIGSNNRSLRSFLEVMAEGEEILSKFSQDGYEAMTSTELGQLETFFNKAEALYLSSSLGSVSIERPQITHIDTSAEYFDQKLLALRESLGIVDSQMSINQRLVRMFAKPMGYDSLQAVLEEMDDRVITCHERSIAHLSSAQELGGELFLRVEPGDILKAVDEVHFANISQNGSVSKEFLGLDLTSDSTPLDTDVSVLPEDDFELEVSESQKNQFQAVIENSVSGPGQVYGNLTFVIKDRGQFYRTNKEDFILDESKYRFGSKQQQLELFHSGIVGKSHFGIRTGFPITEVDFMIVSEEKMHPADLDMVLLSIAKNGYYVPVTDITGKVIFTLEDFNRLRKTFDGVAVFYGDEYQVIKTEVGQRSYDIVQEMLSAIEAEEQRIDQLSAQIRLVVEEVLQEEGIELRDRNGHSALGAELDDIGSTGRHTNVPGDADFDFTLFLDVQDFEKYPQVAEKLLDRLQPLRRDMYQSGDSDFQQMRAFDCQAFGAEEVDIDISFVRKNTNRELTSHEAVASKLTSIREQEGDQVYYEVVANILLAKKVLKEGHAYKRRTPGGEGDGGFGGIGTENWILANGGSFDQACASFLLTAYEGDRLITLDEFKKKYAIYNAGINTKTMRHNNFISELTEDGYQKMAETLRAYVS